MTHARSIVPWLLWAMGLVALGLVLLVPKTEGALGPAVDILGVHVPVIVPVVAGVWLFLRDPSAP